jgi:hypothetical protein
LKRRIQRIGIRNITLLEHTTPGLTQVQQQEMQFNAWTKDGFQKLVQRWRKCIEVLVSLWKNNYAALKITDINIFLCFISLKISFPINFIFKWSQTLSARPRIYFHGRVCCILS